MRDLILSGLFPPLLLSATATAGDDADSDADAAFSTTAAQQVLDHDLAEIGDIERMATKRKEQARQQLAAALRQTRRAEVERGPRYHGMLGSYQDNKGRIPFKQTRTHPSLPARSGALTKKEIPLSSNPPHRS